MSFCVVPSGESFVSAGRYIDHLQNRQGEWRIAERVVIMENNYDVPTSKAFAMTKADDAHPISRSNDDVSYLRPVTPRSPRDTWKSWR